MEPTRRKTGDSHYCPYDPRVRPESDREIPLRREPIRTDQINRKEFPITRSYVIFLAFLGLLILFIGIVLILIYAWTG